MSPSTAPSLPQIRMHFLPRVFSSLDIFGGSLVEYKELVELSKKHAEMIYPTTTDDEGDGDCGNGIKIEG